MLNETRTTKVKYLVKENMKYLILNIPEKYLLIKYEFRVEAEIIKSIKIIDKHPNASHEGFLKIPRDLENLKFNDENIKLIEENLISVFNYDISSNLPYYTIEIDDKPVIYRGNIVKQDKSRSKCKNNAVNVIKLLLSLINKHGNYPIFYDDKPIKAIIRKSTEDGVVFILTT